jgi:hypothetical protein
MSRSVVVALGASASLTLLGCGNAPDHVSWPDVPRVVLDGRSETISISNADTFAGTQVTLRLTGDKADKRSGYYWLVAADNKRVALLWPKGGPHESSGYATSMADLEILAYVNTGPTDTITLPNKLEPGPYWICLEPVEVGSCSNIQLGQMESAG